MVLPTLPGFRKEFQEDTMRYISYAAATILLVAGLCFAQSTNLQPTSVKSTDQNASQPAVRAVATSDVDARLNALERKLDQLENRVNAVLPASPTAAPSDMGDRLSALDQKLSLLEQHNAKVMEGPTVTAGRDTFSITSPDKTFRLRFGGHMQLDSKSFLDNATVPNGPLTDGFTLRRARPILEGDLGRYVDFRVMPDFGNNQIQLYDAYADLKFQPYAALRGGEMKTPLGLEQLQNDADLTFVERSLVTDLVPNRDAGFQLFGKILDRMTYQVAVMNGAPNGTNLFLTSTAAGANGKETVGRLFFTPFAPSDKQLLKGLGFGIAALRGDQNEGSAMPTWKSTGGQSIFFSYTGTSFCSTGASTCASKTSAAPYTAGSRVDWTPQAYYYYGSAGIMAEYAVASQHIGMTGLSGQQIVSNLDNHAFQVAGSYVLTGEKKSFNSVVPKRGLEMNGDKGPGAWELVARFSELNVDPMDFFNYGNAKNPVRFADPTKSAEAAREWVVGVNWYLNYFARLEFNYAQTHFQGGAATSTGLITDRNTEKAVMERLQIAF
jgi:phosphate-selective porin OprO and OprP